MAKSLRSEGKKVGVIIDGGPEGTVTYRPGTWTWEKVLEGDPEYAVAAGVTAVWMDSVLQGDAGRKKRYVMWQTGELINRVAEIQRLKAYIAQLEEAVGA